MTLLSLTWQQHFQTNVILSLNTHMAHILNTTVNNHDETKKKSQLQSGSGLTGKNKSVRHVR